jgi:hypothetical protein
MEPTVATSNYPVPMPDEALQATFRVNIKITKDPSTGNITTYITEMDMSNYDGLIPNVPELLKEFNLSYSLNLLQQAIISAAR